MTKGEEQTAVTTAVGRLGHRQTVAETETGQGPSEDGEVVPESWGNVNKDAGP